MAMPGNQRSLQNLVDDHYASLYRYAYRLTGSAVDAEDLTQEAFCKAQVNFGQFRDSERAKPWLFSILRRSLPAPGASGPAAAVCLARWGRRRRGTVAGGNAGDRSGAELQQALQELPELFRSPIILYYFEDFSYRDIAEQMELPLGTVMSRLARAKAYLRTRLLPAGEVTAPGPRLRRATDGL